MVDSNTERDSQGSQTSSEESEQPPESIPAFIECGDTPVRSPKQYREFFGGIIATTLSPLGSLLVAPQVTTILKGSEEINKSGIGLWVLLIFGGLMMLIGLVGIPLWIWSVRNDRIENGAMARFAHRADECVRAVIRFDKKTKGESGNREVTGAEKHRLLEKITTEATFIIGNRARVCIYWRSEKESRKKQAKYVLQWENVGERNPSAQARAIIEESLGDDHKSFIDVIENYGQRVIIQDTKSKKQRNFVVSPNHANGYRSFILIPIRAAKLRDGTRRTVGCMTVDFPGKKVITEEIELVTSAIAEMFSDVLEDAQDRVFTETTSRGPVESGLDRLLDTPLTQGGEDGND